MVDSVNYAIGGTLESVVSMWVKFELEMTYNINCLEMRGEVDI